MANGDEQKLSILYGVKDIVTRIEEDLKTTDLSARDLDKRVSTLEKTHIEASEFHKAISDAKTYTDGKVEAGIGRGQAKLDDRMVNLRAMVLTDADKKIKERLDEWADERLQPILDGMLEAREERSRAERERAIQQWRNRIALGTAVLLFVVSFYQTFRPKPDNARDYTRPIERLSDIAQ